MVNLLFSDWTGLVRVIVLGVLSYVALILLLRISGKRTLSKMNAFDFVVTVALGSTLATVLLSKEIALAEGILAFAVLISLQFVITWLSIRVPSVRHFVKAEPSLLLYRGQLLRSALRRERVTEGEVLQALREQGIASLDDAEAVVMETDGSFSVIRKSGQERSSTLSNVRQGR